MSGPPSHPLDVETDSSNGCGDRTTFLLRFPAAMSTNAAPTDGHIERELAPYRDRFTEEEQQLYDAGRYAELATAAMDRAQRRMGMGFGLLIALQFIPIVYVVFALLVFGVGPWGFVAGFLVVALLCAALPVKLLVDSHRIQRAATRAWVAAHHIPLRNLPANVDAVELVNRVDPSDRHLLQEGRLRELADRLTEKGVRGWRFARLYALLPLGGLALTGALGVGVAMENGADALVVAAPVFFFVAVAYKIVWMARDSAAEARVGRELRAGLPDER